MPRGHIVAALLVAAMAATPTVSGAQGADAGEFLALTYNVGGLPDVISDVEPSPSENAPLISPLLNDYDLVLLQESWEDPHEIFEDLPIFHHHHAIVAEADHPYRSEPAPNPLGTDTRQLPSADDEPIDALNRMGPALLSDGLNRLSRFPFEPLTRVMWDACYGSLHVTVAEEALGLVDLDGPVAEVLGFEVDGGSTDCAAQKGFSVATTEFSPGVEVDVYNLHADAGGHDRDIDARVDNFDQLADFIVQFSAGRAVIVGGDTNLSFESDRAPRRREVDRRTWEQFQERTGLTEVCAVLDCGDEDDVRAAGFKNIDRFAFRGGDGVQLTPLSHVREHERFSRDDGEPLSDHDPIAVQFRWSVSGDPLAAPAPAGQASEALTATDALPALPATGGKRHVGTIGVALAGAALAAWVARRRLA